MTDNNRAFSPSDGEQRTNNGGAGPHPFSDDVTGGVPVPWPQAVPEQPQAVPEQPQATPPTTGE